MNDETQSNILKSLADETRLRLIRILAKEELNVQEVCEILDLPQPRISRHLSVLRASKLVIDRRDGTRIYYSLATLDDELKPFESYLESIAQSEHEDLNALEETLKKRELQSKDFAAAMAENWDEIGSELHSPTAAIFSLAAMAPKGMVIADLGCGTGLMLPVLSRLGQKVYAVDHSAEMLEVAKQRCEKLEIEHVDFVNRSLDDLEDKVSQCDVMFLHFVLHQVASPQTLLPSIFKYLKPGGRLVIVDRTPHEDETARSRFGSIWLGFSEEKIAGWLESEELEGFNYFEINSSNSDKSFQSFIASVVKKA